MNLPTGLPAALAQGAEEQLSIRVALKDGLTSIPAIHDVVDRAGVLHSQPAGHATPGPKALLCVNI